MSNPSSGGAFPKPPPYPGSNDPQQHNYHNPPHSYPEPPPPPYYSSQAAPPPPGWGPSGMSPPPSNYGATNVILAEPVVFPATQVIIVGGCPACRVGVLEDEFSCLGILCALFFFPIGILCCLAMRDKRCTNCGAIF